MHTDNPYKCDLLKEDYVECLHHRKEVSGGEGVEGPREYDRRCSTEEGKGGGEEGEAGVDC